eukprot:2751326-Rhodomonas_salina.5
MLVCSASTVGVSSPAQDSAISATRTPSHTSGQPTWKCDGHRNEGTIEGDRAGRRMDGLAHRPWAQHDKGQNCAAPRTQTDDR